MAAAYFLLAVIAAAASAVPLRSEFLSEGPYPGGYLREAAYEDSKPLGRNLDSIGGGNLLRDLENSLLRSRAYTFPRASRQNGLDALSGATFGTSKRFDPLSGQVFGSDKRNGMDEIERSGFNSFIKKKNFDEIDRSGFDGFVKRNFDEIDRVGFNGFVKRGAPPAPASSHN